MFLSSPYASRPAASSSSTCRQSYNVRMDAHAGGLGAIHHRPFPMASGEMDRSQFTAFLGQAFRNLAAFSVDGSIHFVCMDWRHVEELLAAGREAFDTPKN